MNTYLPYADFDKTAETLDDKRLNKQRSDVMTILKALSEPAPEDGDEHSSVKMWRGNEMALIRYGMAICLEWKIRGNADQTLPKIMEHRSQFEEHTDDPEWLGDEAFHESHQSHLLRLQPTYYRQHFDRTADDIALIWPRSPEKAKATREEKTQAKAVTKAIKSKDKAERTARDAMQAAFAAGLNPVTLEPMSEEELAAYEDGVLTGEITFTFTTDQGTLDIKDIVDG